MEQLHVAIPQDSFLSTLGTRKGFPAFFISNVLLTDVKDKPFCVSVRLVTAPTLDHCRRVGHIHMSFEGDFSWEGFGAGLAEKGVFAPRVTVFDGHVLFKSLLSSEDCGTGGTHEGRPVLLVVVTLQDRSDHQHNFLFFYHFFCLSVPEAKEEAVRFSSPPAKKAFHWKEPTPFNPIPMSCISDHTWRMCIRSSSSL